VCGHPKIRNNVALKSTEDEADWATAGSALRGHHLKVDPAESRSVDAIDDIFHESCIE
jgi:hypothetical protein